MLRFVSLQLMLLCREKNLEVSKKEAKAKEKKNEEKQAASKDDVDIDHEERLQEVRWIEPVRHRLNLNLNSQCSCLMCIRSRRISTPPSKLPNNEFFQTFICESKTHHPIGSLVSRRRCDLGHLRASRAHKNRTKHLQHQLTSSHKQLMSWCGSSYVTIL